MFYKNSYNSPLGIMEMVFDDNNLIELVFGKNNHDFIINENNVSKTTKKWLDSYFNKKIPNFIPSIKPLGTQFQLGVWEILKEIPFGKVVTYKDIKNEYIKRKNLKQMALQAIGGAISKNRIALIIPCHRVIASDGSLRGFFWGLEKKKALLELEGNMQTRKL